MSFHGMDIESALQHASNLEHQATGEVFAVLTTMSGMVPRLMEAWHGEDANSFEQEWAAHAQSLQQLHSALDDLVRSLRASAEEQRRTSGH